MSDKSLAAHFGVGEKALKMTRKRHRILRPRETWKFNKGHIPFNKGKHFAAGGRSIETRFKKGGEPHNTKSDGFISVRTDKCGRVYRWIRISKGKWQMLHVHNWLKAKRNIPEGHIVVFKSPDTMNCDVSNLELITRAEHCRRNRNRKKAAESLRTTWAVHRTMTSYKLTSPYKWKLKKNVA